MSIHYADSDVTLHHGDCLTVMADLPDASVDAVVTDPPYLLGFMGKAWDSRAAHQHLDFHRAWVDHCHRLLKPGGHLLAFGGTRTWHRLACAVEDAGFEVRDSIAWLYGSGFPKSLDVSKAIDRAAGAKRQQMLIPTKPRNKPEQAGALGLGASGMTDISKPITDDAATWQGWGTALKPAFEPIVVARKPFEGTVATNVLTHGTGALNIDATRTPTGQDYADKCASVVGLASNRTGDCYGEMTGARADSTHQDGRWPTNVLLDAHTADTLNAQAPSAGGGYGVRGGGGEVYGGGKGYAGTLTETGQTVGYGDAGGASRFFPTFRYEAKASTAERPRDGDVAHPTVKPLDLMRWLVRLVTPPGGLVLDPFAGSGTTAEACVLEGLRCWTVEQDATYLPLVVQRLSKPLQVGFGF